MPLSTKKPRTDLKIGTRFLLFELNDKYVFFVRFFCNVDRIVNVFGSVIADKRSFLKSLEEDSAGSVVGEITVYHNVGDCRECLASVNRDESIFRQSVSANGGAHINGFLDNAVYTDGGGHSCVAENVAFHVVVVTVGKVVIYVGGVP